MEIEFDPGKNSYLRDAASVILVVALIVFGVAGRAVTRTGADGNPQILTWADYQLGKAEQVYLGEQAILRADTDELTRILADKKVPSPVAVQVTVNRILDHTSAGVAELTEARAALAEAALTVRDWSVGAVDQNTAIQAVQSAVAQLE